MMNHKLNNFFVGFVLLSCIGLSSCKKKMPADVLSKGEMEDVLVDYHLAKSMAANLPPEEHYKQALYMNYVFEKYGITEEAFDHSLEWYSRNTEDFVKIYDEVTKRLTSQKEDITNLIASSGESEQQQSQTGDTVNVWHKQKLYKLTQSKATNKFFFTIYPDSNYKEKDIILWSIRCSFVSAKQHPQDAVMSLNIKYSTDSIISETRNLRHSGMYDIRIQNDSACKIKEIKGFVYYDQLSHFSKDALIVDKIALTRYHVKKDTKQMTKMSPVNKVDSLKKDTASKHEVIQNTQPVVIDTVNKTDFRTSGPRRKSKKNASNDMRNINNQPTQQPRIR